MSKKSNYITTNRSKHYLKIHLIFVCKYRKPLLMGNLNEDMKIKLLKEYKNFKWKGEKGDKLNLNFSMYRITIYQKYHFQIYNPIFLYFQ